MILVYIYGSSFRYFHIHDNALKVYISYCIELYLMCGNKNRYHGERHFLHVLHCVLCIKDQVFAVILMHNATMHLLSVNRGFYGPVDKTLCVIPGAPISHQ